MERMVNVLEWRKAPAGFGEKVIALVTFMYKHDPNVGDGELTVTRYDRKSEREYPQVVFSLGGGGNVKVIDAQVRVGDKSEWVSTSSLQGVPRDVLSLVKAEHDRRFAASLKPAPAPVASNAGAA